MSFSWVWKKSSNIDGVIRDAGGFQANTALDVMHIYIY